MVASANLGFPRIGLRRELKKALEEHWAGRRTEAQLLEAAAALRREAWSLQQRLGVASIPSNDFSLYDHVLDTCAMLGAVPTRYAWDGITVDLDTYFAMARGRKAGGPKPGAPAMEMTKWFDTNYHYIVPEFEAGQRFRFASNKVLDEFLEARDLGLRTRPVLLGPVSFLLRGKAKSPEVQPLMLLDAALLVYGEVLRRLKAAGAEWVQLDEPCLVLDLDPEARAAYVAAYASLRAQAPGLRLMLATYFGDLGENLTLAMDLAVDGLHLDLQRAPGQLERALAQAPGWLTLSLGVVDGRNVWRSDLRRLGDFVDRAVQARGADRVQVAPSCSLLHAPLDLELETRLDAELRSWLAFGRQKLEEVVVLARAASGETAAVAAALAENRAAMESRRTSTRIHDAAVGARMERVGEELLRRAAAYPERRRAQQERLRLPPLPTTTIGSFPQTAAVRAARAEWRAGKRSEAQYREYLEAEIAACVRFQEEAGLDVLVHGEFERGDMVEFFAEQLRGYAQTEHGWVQSFGSRYVKPPILFGDVSRPAAMSVRWSAYAQSLTARPVKGMLTGPVTMLQWSFVRDDQPRAETALQLALAVRDEVADLERAGIRLIQIDEPAMREGLPLRRAEWPGYLDWAVRAFRLASSGVRNETQIHTHMCYAEFGDIIEAVAALDADALSIETSRSQMELLGAFGRYRYPNGIGPGVYDIHSPRVPTRQEMVDLLRKALAVLAADQLWVNPDCGLKTRRWEEVRPALLEMVAAAREVRAGLT
ncbi:MAG: 5-methyltetrahydropteroyltriglutamate--homocysteine S-methyltransferase [Deltaproteobacteria bacterium]|nr:5-methyltetrahydropteroyltriglutamate--homocysteine S-methyltransferase [Deltaproteobacteria bacterium]